MGHILSSRILDGRRLRVLPILASLLAAFAFSVAIGMAGSTPASAAPLSLNQCNNNGPGPLGATTSMLCTVVVVNTINGGSRGSTTTLTRLCLLGPCAPGNGTFVSNSTDVVTSVNQCNGSDNDAAHPITCTVTITNNIATGTSGSAPRTAATVNQCVGSGTGGGGTVNCDPFPATTTGATVTQCNGSGNGGGGTVHCTVDSASLVSPAIPISVNQCNGTGNPGGSVVTCSTRIFTNFVTPTPGPTTTTPTTTTPTPTGSTGGTGTSTGGVGGTGTSTGGVGGTGTSTGGVGNTGSSAGAAPDQVSRVPAGGAAAGGGSTAQAHDSWLMTLGSVLVLAGAGIALLRLRPRRLS